MRARGAACPARPKPRHCPAGYAGRACWCAGAGSGSRRSCKPLGYASCRGTAARFVASGRAGATCGRRADTGSVSTSLDPPLRQDAVARHGQALQVPLVAVAVWAPMVDSRRGPERIAAFPERERAQAVYHRITLAIVQYHTRHSPASKQCRSKRNQRSRFAVGSTLCITWNCPRRRSCASLRVAACASRFAGRSIAARS